MIAPRPADVLAGAGGVALLVALWLPWYAVEAGGARATASGWEALSVVDVLLALAAAAGIAVLVATVTRRSPTLPVGLAVVGAVAGALALLLVALRILDQPGPNALVDVEAGAWVALAGALAVAAGSWRSMADERNRGVPPVPVELRPAP